MDPVLYTITEKSLYTISQKWSTSDFFVMAYITRLYTITRKYPEVVEAM